MPSRFYPKSLDWEKRYLSLVDNAPIGLAIVSIEGRWIETNKKTEQILGYSKEELFQINFQTITHPDDLEEDLKNAERIIKGVSTKYSMPKRYIRKDGTIVSVFLYVSGVFDKDGNLDYFISQIQDLTDFEGLQKEYNEINFKLQKTNNHLLKTVEELTHFNYFASHDLKENVRTIYNYAQMLLLENKDDENSYHLQRISQRSSQLNDLINDLLIYSKISAKKEKSERFSVISSLSVVLEDFQEDLKKKNIKIIYKFDENKHIVCCKSIFHHLMFNFLSNSIKYSSKNIKIHVKEGKYKYLIKIEDDGEGIDKQYHKKIFDPFFRLSAKLNGTGLGLSLCKKMIEKLQGRIGVRSSENEGSLFWFSFTP